MDLSRGTTYLRSDVDFVLLVFLVFLVASDQEGVGSRLLQQEELHTPRCPQTSPQGLGLVRVQLAGTGVSPHGTAGARRSAGASQSGAPGSLEIFSIEIFIEGRRGVGRLIETLNISITGRHHL